MRLALLARGAASFSRARCSPCSRSASRIYLVNRRVTSEAERTLQREIVATGALVDQLRTTRTETFTMMARLIADAPKLKAAVDTNDPPTVQDELRQGYQDRSSSRTCCS